jgi:hypothetical protein
LERSHSRPALREESTPQTFGNVLSSNWIPPAERDGNDAWLELIPIPNDTRHGIAYLLETSAKDTISAADSAMPFVLPLAIDAR